MLQPGDPMANVIGFWPAVIYATFKASVAIGLFGMVAIGYLFARLTAIERVLCFIAAVMLFGEFAYSDPIGYLLAAAIIARHWFAARNAAPAAA